MKEWGIIIAAILVIACIVHSIYEVGRVLAKGLDELHEKVDAVQEKLGEVEEKIEEFETEKTSRRYVNPIDL